VHPGLAERVESRRALLHVLYPAHPKGSKASTAPREREGRGTAVHNSWARKATCPATGANGRSRGVERQAALEADCRKNRRRMRRLDNRCARSAVLEAWKAEKCRGRQLT